MLDSLASSLGELPFGLGQDYRVVTVSISPRDNPAVAAEVKRRYVAPGSKLAPGDDWHFLTGDTSGVQELARTIGFVYSYDAQQKQFAHPAGLVVLTPDGRIARYLFGLDFPPRDLRFALIDASQRRIGSPTDQLLLTCYHYEATLGRYAGLALESVRIAGIATVLAIATGLGLLWRRDLARS
jgi:protein SCO1/2